MFILGNKNSHVNIKNNNIVFGILLSAIIATFYSFQIISNTGLYNDLEFYFNSYLTCESQSLEDCVLWLIGISGKVEPGIAVVYSFIKIFNVKSEMAVIGALFFLMNIAAIFYVVRFKRYSIDEIQPLLRFCFLLLICFLNYYYFSITTYFVRQVFGVFLFLLSTQIKSKIIKILLLLASVLFHYSSIILIIGYIGSMMALRITKGKSKILLFAMCVLVALAGYALQSNFGFLAINSNIDPYMDSNNVSSAIHTIQQYAIALVILVYLQIRLNKKDENRMILNTTMLFLVLFSIINFLNVHAAYRVFIPVGLYCSLLPLTHYRYLKNSFLFISIYTLLILINFRLSYRYFMGEYVPS